MLPVRHKLVESSRTSIFSATNMKIGIVRVHSSNMPQNCPQGQTPKPTADRTIPGGRHLKHCNEC